MTQPGLSNAAAGKIPQICATSPASEKKIRSRPLAQPTIQGLNLITDLIINILLRHNIEIINNNFHGFLSPGGFVSPSGRFASLSFDHSVP